MKLVLLCVLIVTVVSSWTPSAHAGADWGFHQIVGYVDLAERRLGENDVASARSNLQSARDMMPEASPAAKADKGWSGLEARIARLDKAIAVREAAASKIESADEVLHNAEADELQARVELGNDNYDRAAAFYQKCSEGLTKAASIDAAVASRKGASGITHGELVAKCKDGAAAMSKRASSEGEGAGETEQGKAALDGFALASKAVAAKKLAALDLAAALKGAEACKNNTSYLTSLRLRNNKPVYDGKKAKLGEMAIDDMNARCTKMETELKARPAFGCGRHYVDVSQDRASVFDRWNRVTDSGKSSFEAMDCSDMPKRSVFPGASAMYKATYYRACGSDAIYIIQHNRWLEHPTQRQMSGECWKKGNLTFHK